MTHADYCWHVFELLIQGFSTTVGQNISGNVCPVPLLHICKIWYCRNLETFWKCPFYVDFDVATSNMQVVTDIL
jgi:hypothetical protein